MLKLNIVARSTKIHFCRAIIFKYQTLFTLELLLLVYKRKTLQLNPNWMYCDINIFEFTLVIRSPILKKSNGIAKWFSTLCVFHTLFSYLVSLFCSFRIISIWTSVMIERFVVKCILGILVSYNILIGFKTLNMTLLLYLIYHLINLHDWFFIAAREPEKIQN